MCTENHGINESKRVLIIGGKNPETALLLMPAIKQIREQNKGFAFDILCGHASEEILKETGWFDKIITFDNFLQFSRIWRILRKEKYSMVICFQTSIFPYIIKAKKKMVFLLRSLFAERFFTHESVNYLKLIEPFFGKPQEKGLYYPVKEFHRQKVKNFLNLHNIPTSATLVAIHPGNTNIADKWSSKNYSIICDTLIEEYNARIFLFGNPNDPSIKEIINFTQHKNEMLNMTEITNPCEVIAFIEKSNLAITQDSIFLYLACSVKTPVISIFGAGNPYRYGPLGTKYITIHTDMNCFPCDRKRKCRRNYQCIKIINAEKVIDAARLMLDESKQLFLFE